MNDRKNMSISPVTYRIDGPSINGKWDRCHWCLTEGTLEGGSVDIESGAANQQVTCLSCGQCWTDVYKMSHRLDYGENSQ